MELEILISTMHQQDYSLLDRIGIQTNAVVVNQADRESIDEISYNGNNVLWINTMERGLSKSRNMAIAHASAEICLLVDDDEELSKGYADIIKKAFEKYPNATVIGFQVEGIEKKFKDYSGKEEKVSFVRSMKMASVELAFKREAIIKNSLRFNESIGTGTQFFMGEESVFLFNIISLDLEVYHYPKQIACLHISESTWFRGFDADYFKARGAVFTAMSRRYALLLILQFAIRKANLYKESISVLNAIGYMLEGRRAYLKTDREV